MEYRPKDFYLGSPELTPPSSHSNNSPGSSDTSSSKSHKAPYKHRPASVTSQSFSIESKDIRGSVSALEQQLKQLKLALPDPHFTTFDTKESRRSISRLSTDIDRKDSESHPNFEEFRRLAKLYSTAESDLAVVKAERDKLAARVRDLESRHNSSNLYDILGKLQSENKLLMLEVRRLQEQVNNQGGFRTLEKQFSELESMHSDVVVDSNRVKQELEMHKEAWRQQHEKLVSITAVVREVRKEMTQLTEIAKIVRNGAGVSTALILGHMARTGKEDEDAMELSISKEVKGLKEEIGTLKSLLADLYAETSQSCSYQ